jgi:hypothetical protein
MDWAKCYRANFVQEKVGNRGELSAPNLWHKLGQLMTGQKAEQIGPSFQWQVTKNG